MALIENPADTADKREPLFGVRFSVLDLSHVTEGTSPADAFAKTLELARQAESWGYHRFWLAEHHNMPGIASSATSVVIGYVAAGTSRIRVGSGGIMLPNHAPLAIAEQFGTLESLHPGRIDLGLGRAPGSDQLAAQALRRGLGVSNGKNFPELLRELQDYLTPEQPDKPGRVRAIPGEGLDIPIWLLGSSDFSARLAGELGLPFAFASHFAPDYLLPALALYRSAFQPSATLDKPRVMVGLSLIAAETDEEAALLATSQKVSILNFIRGRMRLLAPPLADAHVPCTPEEKEIMRRFLGYAVIGGRDSVRGRLREVVSETGADELIVSTQVYDFGARLRSHEIVAEIFNGINA